MFSAVTAIHVYDTVALIRQEVDTIMIVIKPVKEGMYAKYNLFHSEISGKIGTLHMSDIDQHLLDFNLVPDRTQNFDYLLNIITIRRDGKKYLLQKGVEVDASISLALFT